MQDRIGEGRNVNFISQGFNSGELLFRIQTVAAYSPFDAKNDFAIDAATMNTGKIGDVVD
jgi:hypothetical protein